MSRRQPALRAIPDEARLVEELVRRILGWRSAPGRFLKAGRGWIPTWRFQPFEDLADAFQLLDRAADRFCLTSDRNIFTAEVQIGERRGRASGQLKARTITTAIARGLGMEI